jgi:hypothetical protein
MKATTTVFVGALILLGGASESGASTLAYSLLPDFAVDPLLPIQSGTAGALLAGMQIGAPSLEGVRSTEITFQLSFFGSVIAEGLALRSGTTQLGLTRGFVFVPQAINTNALADEISARFAKVTFSFDLMTLAGGVTPLALYGGVSGNGTIDVAVSSGGLKGMGLATGTAYSAPAGGTIFIAGAHEVVTGTSANTVSEPSALFLAVPCLVVFFRRVFSRVS